MSMKQTMEKLTGEARSWIRRKSLPAFKSSGGMDFELSVRWWKGDGCTTFWLCKCGIADDAEADGNVILEGGLDDGPKMDSDRRFHVDRIDIPGGSSWEIDEVMNTPLLILTDSHEWTGPVCNLGMLLNAFLWISTDNVMNNGLDAGSVLAGRFVPLNFDGSSWDDSFGPCPDHRWYFQPWGFWRRGQTSQTWGRPCWLRPVPMYGQLLDPDDVLWSSDVDVDMDGKTLRI